MVSRASWGSLCLSSSLSPGPLACCSAPPSPLRLVADTSLSQRCSQAGGSSEKSSESDVGQWGPGAGAGGAGRGSSLAEAEKLGPAGNLRSEASVRQRLEISLPSERRNKLARKTEGYLEGTGLLSIKGQGDSGRSKHGAQLTPFPTFNTTPSIATYASRAVTEERLHPRSGKQREEPAIMGGGGVNLLWSQ